MQAAVARDSSCRRLRGFVVGAVRVPRARDRALKVVVPLTLAVIFVLLYLLFRSLQTRPLVMAAVPFALVGGFWLVWALGHSISVASAVGFIALAAIAAEFGVVMLVYLKNAWRAPCRRRARRRATLLAAIREGAVLRVRPKAMTVAVVIAGLLPIMWGTARLGGDEPDRRADGRRHGDPRRC
jgi:Cu(I)/Ag(I) efflux system membrane protein CusA/SilA